MLENSFGLCLLFPCLLWDLDEYLSYAPNGRYWSYSQTSSSFPELTDEVITEISKTKTDNLANKLRIEFLKEFIVELEKNIQL